MLAPSVRPLLLLALGLGLSGCTTLGRGPAHVEELHLDLPPAAAAAIASAALRDALRAEPVDPALGPPATARSDGGFDVVYAQDRAGRWLPRARQRLRVRCDELSAGPRVDVLPVAPGQELRTAGDRATVRLAFTARESGTVVRIELPPGEAMRLEPLLRRTFSLATSASEHAPGLAEPHLAAWRTGRLLRAGLALRARDPDGSAELLQAAARLPATPGLVHAELGAAATAQGDASRAAAALRVATLLADDPCTRAALARRSAIAARCEARPTALRSAAIAHLRDGELAAAETLLHSARRGAPSPAVDYGLLGRVHDRRGDPMAAFAAGVLSREYSVTAALAIPRQLARLAELVGIPPGVTNALAASPPR